MEDAEFEEYIGRRSRLSNRYHELRVESPPKELDEAVLSLARSGQGLKRPRAPGREVYIAWIAPVAFAATIVLVFTVVLQIVIRPQPPTRSERDADRTPGLQAEAKAELASQERALASAQRPADKLEEAAVEHRVASNTDSAAPALSVLDRARLAAPSPAESVTADTRAALAKSQASPTRIFGESGVAAQQPAAATPAAGTLSAAQGGSAYGRLDAADGKARDPKLWLAEIERLRKDGRTTAADEQMMLFLEKYPNYFSSQPPPPDTR
jgi:hypothetical protein